MISVEELGEHVRENRSGMFVDLVFAIAWVAVVSIVFGALNSPQWASHLAMFGGVVAYFGFFGSIESLKQERK
ncbi:hypothetical protein [Haladaptatus sp. DYF46]|uniref:hypothetical protein n=1 Tax=Haladaptatus sp. DYF46 TaxID=2886041 RepID=UPI001E5D682F|nr:hypothetical protein [Haladaptatus sp. DYF46]